MGMMDKFKRDRAEKKARKAAVRGGYRFFVGGLEMDVSKMTSGPEKLVRVALDRQVGKFLEKSGDLAHPESGERPEIHFVSPKLDGKGIQMRLVTDSQELRDYLSAKGFPVHGEIVGAEPAALESAPVTEAA